MQETEPWLFTVVRTEGLHLMRPEKSWRPIVTVDVDHHARHETILGCDGQNPNSKETFTFAEADIDSKVEINIWYRSQTKKKAKKRKRNLVGSASHSLGELMKKQSTDRKLEVRLQCQSPKKKCVASRGKPQKGAVVHLRLRVPPSVQLPSQEEDHSVCGYSSEAGTSEQSPSETLSVPPSPTSDTWKDEDTLVDIRRRKPRLKGYSLDTDDEQQAEDDYDEQKPFLDDHTFDFDCEDSCFDDRLAIKRPSDGIIRISEGTLGWIMASVLPQYTEKVEIPPNLSTLERILSSFTMYSELKEATLDSHYEQVFARLQMEWTYVGGLLVALAAVNTAVFSITSDSVFKIDPYARISVASSSIASGLGISCDAWFLLRYNWADLHTFIARARDLYGSYFFFSLSARVPAICMFVSALSLMGFLGLVAFKAWPTGVMVTCFLIGLIMTLQFLVYGAHWCGSRVMEAGRASRRVVVKSVRWVIGRGGREASGVADSRG